ncbi:helix-turn-helix domain-containing protein [Bacillus phage vB_BanS_Chewbecca]|uniref:HTH domain-containing XRE family protein n=3 Tax=Tsamsavirus TaxID=3044849 RepID=A0AAE9CES0_9CAUD|nr:HTH domain-containing XRE family protein [Bacillus phage vB_BanS_Skywalker]YP_010680960.1 helix-turn-helix domain-containing protein [Bacillus phage vB_BanS_MrDarsey]YP_010681200.1 helix-turn-helix domain-containing protein [Bacillus phage vB_BanS_Chewbecca]UGO46140.1 helix-turn-helix domain-containing protein [Bacillus phage vB_BanS_Chewbecca]UGO47896.1 helix-turn-helix domain-containing protein [Bacillus phage vB_BanS_MrDarsey]UGO51361.1 HTH domain-containing XRE family protein [Bacillus 
MKVKSKFQVSNKLDSYIVRETGRRMAETGEKATKGQIMNEIAIHSGVGLESVKLINRNVSQPSLVVALRMADYFDTKVENIFNVLED